MADAKLIKIDDEHSLQTRESIEKVKPAAEDSLDRLFPQFHDAEDNRWNSVINRAKNKDANALQAVELQQEADAVRDERRFLEDSDPVPPIHDKLVKLLRTAVKKAHTATKDVHQHEMKAWLADAEEGPVARLKQETIVIG